MSSSGLNRARRVLRHRGLRAATLGAADELRARLELVRQRRHEPHAFFVDGVEHAQLVHLHNRTWRNERTVEIPLALSFLDRHPGQTLELGNVLVNYGRTGHVVVDKYEEEPRVVNVDVVDYQPPQRFDAIVAVSTLEHVGWDEEPKEADKTSRAVLHLRRLLRPSGRMLVTCPLGYNPHLDASIASEAFGADHQAFLISNAGRWAQTDRITASAHARMGRHGANALWVAEFAPS